MEGKDNIRDNVCNAENAVHSPEGGRSETGTAAFGKFKSPDALYRSYIELEAEFTKRSQQLKRLKELCENKGISFADKGEESERTKKTAVAGRDGEAEAVVSAEAANAGEAVREEASPEREEPRGAERKKEETSDKVPLSDELKESVIREYLDSVAGKKIPLMRGGGVSVPAEKRRPKTVGEAGGLALRYFKGE